MSWYRRKCPFGGLKFRNETVRREPYPSHGAHVGRLGQAEMSQTRRIVSYSPSCTMLSVGGMERNRTCIPVAKQPKGIRKVRPLQRRRDVTARVPLLSHVLVHPVLD